MSTAVAHVLFLDIDFRPLHVSPLHRALKKVATGKVEVIEYSRDRMVQGVTETFPMPSVVRVLRRFKRDKIRVKFSRLNIYARDGFVCQYDGQRYMTEDLNFDHVIPRSQGGKTSWENIVTCCLECNMRKANRTPAEAGMKLIRQPRKPHSLPSVLVKIDPTKMPPEWANYWSEVIEG